MTIFIVAIRFLRVDAGELNKRELEKVRSMLEECEEDCENLIGILLEIQRRLGYIPPDAMAEVARFLHVSETDVWSVATFYNEFRFVPKGKYHVRVCLGTACHIKGGRIIMQSWERKLDIKEGEVTGDLRFSLDSVGCVGCCSLAPVVVMNEQVHGNMSPIGVDGLILKTDIEKGKTGE